MVQGVRETTGHLSRAPDGGARCRSGRRRRHARHAVRGHAHRRQGHGRVAEQRRRCCACRSTTARSRSRRCGGWSRRGTSAATRARSSPSGLRPEPYRTRLNPMPHQSSSVSLRTSERARMDSKTPGRSSFVEAAAAGDVRPAGRAPKGRGARREHAAGEIGEHRGPPGGGAASVRKSATTKLTASCSRVDAPRLPRPTASRRDRCRSPLTSAAPRSAAAIASTPEPVPRSSTRLPRTSNVSEQRAGTGVSMHDARCRSPCDGSMTISVAPSGTCEGRSHGGAMMKGPTSTRVQRRAAIAPPSLRRPRPPRAWRIRATRATRRHAPASRASGDEKNTRQRSGVGRRRGTAGTSGPTGRRAAAADRQGPRWRRREVVEHGGELLLTVA